MKISPIQNYNVNFGYDKALNKELKAELKNYPNKELAGVISRLNSQCNSLENYIRKNDNPSVDDFIDMFITLKEVLTSYVSVTFENLKFADREYKHYHDEFVKESKDKKNSWLNEVCDVIGQWTSSPVSVNKSKNSHQVEKNNNNSTNISSSEAKPSEKHDLTSTLKTIASSAKALDEFIPTEDTPKGFVDVAGMDKVKEELSDGILQLINDPKQAQLDFEEYGKKIPRGLLLYGPPGCGKTYITQALSQEAGIPLYLLNISKTGSMYVNMTSKNIQKAFDEAIEKAKTTGKPCLLFMDEIDTLGFNRDSQSEQEDIKQVGTLLQAMDKAKSNNVIVIGATNKYKLLDPAVKRRFDSKTFIGIPDFDARKALLIKLLSPRKKAQTLLADSEAIDEISKQLNGYSNDSICKIISNASSRALKRNRADISLEDFQTAIKETSEEKPDIKDYLDENGALKPKIGFSIS